MIFDIKSKLIDIFKKKNNFSFLIKSLNLLGDLHLLLGEVKEAEDSW